MSSKYSAADFLPAKNPIVRGAKRDVKITITNIDDVLPGGLAANSYSTAQLELRETPDGDLLAAFSCVVTATGVDCTISGVATAAIPNGVPRVFGSIQFVHDTDPGQNIVYSKPIVFRVVDSYTD